MLRTNTVIIKHINFEMTSGQTPATSTAATVKMAQQLFIHIRLLRWVRLRCCPLTQAYRGHADSILANSIWRLLKKS